MEYKKFIPLTYDLAIKAFFYFDTELTKAFLEAVSPINEIDDLKMIGNEVPVTNMNGYHMTTDLMFEVNCKTELNIEVNRAVFEIVKEKSISYFGKYLSLRVLRGENIKKPQRDFIQMNLNAVEAEDGIAERVVKLMEEGTNKVITESAAMYLYNLAQYYKMYYNGDRSKKTSFCAFLCSKSIEEANEILKPLIPDRLRERFVRRYVEMCNDPRIITEYEQNLAEQFLRNKMLDDANSKGVEQGIKQGIEKGSLQEKNQFVINLLKEKMSYDFISRVSGLTIEEIENIKKSMNQE